MKAIRILTFGFIVLAGLVVGLNGQDQEHPGLKVGEIAPSFALKDQDGEEVKLEDLIKEQAAALVFYRSASW